MLKMRVSLLRIFLSFAKIGAVTFGGGYAMLPILKRDFVEQSKWLSEEDLLDYYALAQSTPGLIAINMGMYIAYPLRGIMGGVAAGLGVITPSIIIILIIAALLSSFFDLVMVAHAFAGIRIVVAALILDTALKLVKTSIKGRFSLLIFSALLLLSLFSSLNPIYLILASAVAGVLWHAKYAKPKADKE